MAWKKHIYCPECGAKNSSDASFCDSCGADLHKIEGGNSNPDKSQQKDGVQPTTNSVGRRPFGMREVFILVTIVLLGGFFIYGYFFVSTPSVFPIPASTSVPLQNGYVFEPYNFTVPSGDYWHLVGKFTSNATTTWILGPPSVVYNIIHTHESISNISNYILYNSTISSDIIANSTSDTFNLTIPPGTYTITFWGFNFTADTVVFPDGMNITAS